MLGHSITTGPVWTRVHPVGLHVPTPEHPLPERPLPEHGWKLHISARPVNLPSLAALLLPVLLEERVSFKLARTVGVLAGLNKAEKNPAAVGKAVTVYPEPDQVRRLGLRLAALLRGHTGPRILSDRAVAPDAPVYYRYGPFGARWQPDASGSLAVVAEGPDGERFASAASLEYRQPSWVRDPFGGAGAPEKEVDDGAGHVVLGGRYRVIEGVHGSARGNVYRAVDLRGSASPDSADARHVIVKQARAYVGESLDGTHDLRTRLRNERRILEACADAPNIPRFLDHFAHDGDEYLVTTDAGTQNLYDRIREHGGFLPRVGDPEPEGLTFARLATQLASILVELHARGVVMRDVTPANIVLDGPDDVRLIDFGISALGGLHLPGATPGYAPPSQHTPDHAPVPEDDCWALGQVLANAATGLPPVTGADTDELARLRTMQGLYAVYGESRPELTSLVADLLGSEGAGQAVARLRKLASADFPAASVPAPPALPAAPATLLQERVLASLVEGAADYHLGAERGTFPSVDAALYTGSAGIGLELLHHQHRAGVGELLEDLARHAAESLRRAPMRPGLYSGRSGTDVFLDAAARAGIRTAGRTERVATATGPAERDGFADVDVISGHAGVGLAALMHLALNAPAGAASSGPAPANPARTDPGACEGLPLADHRKAALAAAERLLRHPDALTLPPDALDAFGTTTGLGYAHGFAGITDFLVLLAADTDDPSLLETAHRCVTKLASRVPEAVALSRAGAPGALPMSASWCRGLAGLVPPLRHGWSVFGDRELRTAAEQAAVASAEWVPRLGNLGQCCGAAGVGDVLIDLARATGSERHWEAAHEVARHLLRRSHGPDEAPRLLVNARFQEAPHSWAQGHAGILAFVRRLGRPETPGLLPEPGRRL
ncbi:hypothetical protein GCM10010329_44240 [Streptomyces spiroverticillatus]|uniref:non-specific serine/threonine protein kinase n=1 Tax=Streptomyces finlayi TaxID=67296 RepID=A0A918X061_9ACTN|nr:hypothetical protein GCM10010329_44240 [Streptomyces spiroverticillatus]GHC98701.1 hypothetical protein GCM10010334_41420 [Streptomyces finlayi]